MLTGQCQKITKERDKYKIINYCRRIDIILNKNWEEILDLVDLKKDDGKSNKSVESKSDSDSESKINVYSDEEVTDVDGIVIKTRGNECWKMIEKKYNIHKIIMI
jgi:hypothetical protein